MTSNSICVFDTDFLYGLFVAKALKILLQLESIDYKQLFFGKSDDRELIEEFKRYKSKKISIVDCSNLMLARKLNAKIVIFDKFNPSEILIQL